MNFILRVILYTRNQRDKETLALRSYKTVSIDASTYSLSASVCFYILLSVCGSLCLWLSDAITSDISRDCLFSLTGRPYIQINEDWFDLIWYNTITWFPDPDNGETRTLWPLMRWLGPPTDQHLSIRERPLRCFFKGHRKVNASLWQCLTDKL